METIEGERVVKQWAQTRLKMSKENLTWTIDNFSFQESSELGLKIESPTFTIAGNKHIKWRLILCSKDENRPEYLSILLHLESDYHGEGDKPKMAGKYRIGIVSVDSKPEFDVWYNITSFDTPKYYVERYNILSTSNRSRFLQNDILKIFCEIRFVTDSISISSQNNIEQFKVPECKISDDFGRLLGNHKFSDITLVVGEHEFRAHKAILAARSEVFAAMFLHDMEELNTGRVTITDISMDVIQEVLIFIYTGEAPNLKAMANHLLAAADKYALKKLKVMSEKALFDQLTVETAIDTLILADLHSAKQLKHQTLQFIKMHAMHIIATEAWQNMRNSNAYFSLITDILEASF